MKLSLLILALSMLVSHGQQTFHPFRRAQPVSAASGGAVYHVRSETNAWKAGTTSVTTSIQSDGTGRALLVWVSWYPKTAIPTVTFNASENFTEVVRTNQFDSTAGASLFKLMNPSATTANVVVSFGASSGEGATVTTLLNNATTLTETNVVFYGAPVTGLTNSLTTVTNEMLLQGLTFFTTAVTLGAGQTWANTATNASGYEQIHVSYQTNAQTQMSATAVPSGRLTGIAARVSP